MIHRIRLFMEGNEHLRKLVPVIQNTGVMRYRKEYLVQKKIAKRYMDQALAQREGIETCYKTHRAEFKKLSKMLEDDFSRKTLRTIIKYRITLRWQLLRKIVVQPQYFVKDILLPMEGEVFIDGGAYTGDTISELVSVFGEGVNYCKKIYAFEPDAISRRVLVERCKDYDNIVILPVGLWSEKTYLNFNMKGNRGSRICKDGTQVISVDSIDNLCADEKVTFIKLDVEGSEQEALRGAERVIRRDKPRLAICIYHRPEDYFQIPFMIKEMVPEYKFYIRHHMYHQYDTVLYAVMP